MWRNTTAQCCALLTRDCTGAQTLEAGLLPLLLLLLLLLMCSTLAAVTVRVLLQLQLTQQRSESCC
jgi:hypothetical protein